MEHIFFFSLLLLLATCSSSSTATALLLGRVNPGGKLLTLLIGTPPLRNHTLQLDLDADVSLLASCSHLHSPISCSSSSSTLSCPSAKCSPSRQCLEPITKSTTVPLFQETLVLTSTAADGSTNPSSITLKGIAFGCHRKGQGAIALSKNKLSLPSQLSKSATIQPKFTLCLSQTSTSQIFFGNDSGIVLGGIGGLTSSSSVSFLHNSFHPSQYYLPVDSIRVIDSGNVLGTSSGSFAVDPKTGIGGMKLSSRDKYTKLATPAYVVVKEAFKKYASTFNISIVPSVGPLELCLNGSMINGNRLGPVVPGVEIVMGGVSWRLSGYSVVEYVGGGSSNSACLAFVDAGPLPVTSSIGLYQQFDNLLSFDIGASRFGFIDQGLHLYRLKCGL